MQRSFWRGIGTGLIWAIASTTSAFAHEFWLLPDNFTPQPEAQFTVDLRNGQQMKGVSLPYLPQSVARFEVIAKGAALPVVSRLGDIPALSMSAPSEGLVAVVHETTNNTVTYDSLAQFEQFLTHKAASRLLATHGARGLPESGFSETYRRYAKTLIGVGNGHGQDQAAGLRIEIVALANPYTDDLAAGLPLQVRLDGAPHAGAQIDLFATAPDGTVTETFFTTDAAGVALVPAKPAHTYLADSVAIYALSNDDAAAGPVWHSDWASLTYMVP